MPITHLPKAGLLTLVLVFTLMTGWEMHWRNQGFVRSYDDDESLWASKRKLIYQTSPSRPVIIGSSRVKFDLDLATWESITGEKPVQLAMVGTTPRPVLTDLGNDALFKGTLIIGVVERFFFAPPGGPSEIAAKKRISFYPKWSLSQQISFQINRALESQLFFLDENKLSLNALLNWLRLPNRPGVFVFPKFPNEFNNNQFDRQSKMSDRFLADTTLQNQMKKAWTKLGGLSTKRGVGGDTLLAMLNSVKQSVDKIRARGGKVLFVRMPSSGLFREAEKAAYPRELYWERLLSHTQTQGIYYEDYPALSRYECLEWSHLSPLDAVTFTQDFIPIMQQATGWLVQKEASTVPASPTYTLSFQ